MSNFTLALNNPLQDPFHVGGWLVEPQLNRLSARSNLFLKRSLEPRLMHLLCYLAANPRRVLSREELSRELWPRVIVNENSLTRAVSELRKQLRLQDRPDFRYLETIPKKGYRLLQEVQFPVSREPIPDTLTTGSIATLVLPARNWQKPLRNAAFLLLIAVLTTARQPLPGGMSSTPSLADQGLVYDQVVDNQTLTSDGQFRLSAHQANDPIPTDAAIKAPVISSDGSTLAYLQQVGDLSLIYVGQVKSPEQAVPVFSSSHHLSNLQWSPVGNALLFASEPVAVKTTLLNSVKQKADLVMLDLDSMTIRILIDNSPEHREPTSTV